MRPTFIKDIMSQFITVATFTYPSELVVIRARLEAEGIECIVRDELTAQVHNFYSNAIGGIKLQVRAEDAVRAMEILKDNGYGIEKETSPSTFWNIVNTKTQSIPFVKHYTPEVRLILLITPVIVAMALIAYLATIPTKGEYLSGNSWCLLYVTYSGEDYPPNTTGLQLSGNGCADKIVFSENGEVELPGFNSAAISGSWEILDDGLRLSRLDTFQFILEGDYAINKGHKNMELVSGRTTIHCTKSW